MCSSDLYPNDLKKKIRKAKACKKPAFIHVLSPCPPGWEYSEEKGITVARLSVETNFFPLYEFEDGNIKVKKNKKKKPVKEYLQLQGRFSHLTDEEIDNIQKNVDMAFEKLLRLEEFGKTQGDN